MAVGGNPLLSNNKAFQPNQPQYATFGQPPASNQQGQYGQGQGQAQYGQFSNEQLEQMYNRPPATPTDMGRMTMDDVIMKTGFCLALVLAGAVVGWMIPALMWPGLIGGLVLGLVNAFKREPSPGLILAYAGLQGLFLGGLSGVMESMYPGIVVQAVIGTLCVFAVTLVLFRSGKVRATPKATKFFLIALIGYALFSLVNLGIMIFGNNEDAWGLRTSVEIFGIPLGVFIGIFAIGLAAFSLIIDFTSISDGVRNGVPAKFAWAGAFGLTVTLIWLYVEILRLLAILRGSD